MFDNLSFTGRADYTYQSSRPPVTAAGSPAYFVIGASHLTSLHALHLFNGFEPISGQALDSNLIKTVTAAPPRTIRMTLTNDF